MGGWKDECRDFYLFLLDFFTGKPPPDVDRARALQLHYQQCSHCRDFTDSLARQKQLGSVLRDLLTGDSGGDPDLAPLGRDLGEPVGEHVTANRTRRETPESEGKPSGDEWEPAGDVISAWAEGNYALEPERHVLGCLKCHAVQHLGACANCGSTQLCLAISRGIGVLCVRCHQGFTSWRCECGCENPISSETLLVKKIRGSCFIATVACGSGHVPEVHLLREFRDRYLIARPLRRKLVSAYYRLSPPLARCIAGRNALRFLARLTIVWPLVMLLRVFVRGSWHQPGGLLCLLRLRSGTGRPRVCAPHWAT